jgi:hypothetical protein
VNRGPTVYRKTVGRHNNLKIMLKEELKILEDEVGHVYGNTVSSGHRALIKGVGIDVHECLCRPYMHCHLIYS